MCAVAFLDLTRFSFSGSLKAPYLSSILASLVAQGLAIYDPPKQTRSVLLYWRLPSEWAEILFEWVRPLPHIHLPINLNLNLNLNLNFFLPPQASSTAQLNSILTFYEITSPDVPSQLTDLPPALLRSAIAFLAKSGRAQTIEAVDGGGVRFFSGKGTG